MLTTVSTVAVCEGVQGSEEEGTVAEANCPNLGCLFFVAPGTRFHLVGTGWARDRVIKLIDWPIDFGRPSGLRSHWRHRPLGWPTRTPRREREREGESDEVDDVSIGQPEKGEKKWPFGRWRNGIEW